jgi:hypothetical protein
MPNGDEKFEGSSLYFVDHSTGKKKFVNFAPGAAVMHLGAIPHAALPITNGERWVLWLYGKRGRRAQYPYRPEEQMSREESWTKPAQDSCEPLDKWTPF